MITGSRVKDHRAYSRLVRFAHLPSKQGCSAPRLFPASWRECHWVNPWVNLIAKDCDHLQYGAPGISYHGYAKGTAKASDEGVLVAAFDGAHGWFWRNRGKEVVTVTLRTNGNYQELKRM